MVLTDISLEAYFQTNFLLNRVHKYSIAEIENWVPYERDRYIALISQHLNKEKFGHLEQPGNDGGYSQMLAEMKKNG